MDVLPNPLDDDIMTYNKVVRGTAILFLLPLDFLDSKILHLILPSFMTGYIFVNLAGIWTALHGRVDMLADFHFASIGIFVNICSGLYLFYYWIDWLITAFESGNGSDGATFLILAGTCLLNAIAMGFQFSYSIVEKNRRATYRNTNN